MEARHGERLCAAGQALADATGRPLLMQCHRANGEQFRVTAEWLRPQTSPVAHAKSSLVAGYERPIFGGGHLETGPPSAVLDLDGQRQLIPALCYELYAGSHLRRSVLAGGQFIAHQVSFGAFDRQPIDLWDQPMARLRAVAYGVPILRSSNRAPIGWIDANGRVRAESERFGRRVECHTVWSPAAQPTLHARIAPVAAWLPALVLLGLIGVARRRRTTSSTSTKNRRRS